MRSERELLLEIYRSFGKVSTFPIKEIRILPFGKSTFYYIPIYLDKQNIYALI